MAEPSVRHGSRPGFRQQSPADRVSAGRHGKLGKYEEGRNGTFRSGKGKGRGTPRMEASRQNIPSVEEKGGSPVSPDCLPSQSIVVGGTDGQHRAICVLHDLFSHGTEQDQVDALASAGAHNDDVGLFAFGEGKDFFSRVADDDNAAGIPFSLPHRGWQVEGLPTAIF